jgi:hypothetical protein
MSMSEKADAPPLGRDARIDFFRGFALLSIFVDHIPGNILSRVTLHNYGFSDAAEIFVLLAGVSAALAYSGRSQANFRIARRIARIYVTQVSLLLMAAGVLAVVAANGHAELGNHSALAPFLHDLPTALSQTLFLSLQPEYIDILPLYILLLLWLPLFLPLATRSLRLSLALSFGAWCGANYFGLNLPGPRNGGWFFNPLAWQLLFSIGVGIGLQEAKGDALYRLPRARLILVLAVGYLLFSFLYNAPWAQIPVPAIRQFRVFPADMIGVVSKTYESPWRLAHVLCLAYVAAWAVPRRSAWLLHSWASLISALGRWPLTIFALASSFSVLGGIAGAVYGGGAVLQLSISVFGIALLIGIGSVLQYGGLRGSVRRWTKTLANGRHETAEAPI